MSRKVCPTCHMKCRHFKREPGLDIYGKSSIQLANVPQIPCSRCMRSVAATRFASHLEKCMGMEGEQARELLCKSTVLLKSRLSVLTLCTGFSYNLASPSSNKSRTEDDHSSDSDSSDNISLAHRRKKHKANHSIRNSFEGNPTTLEKSQMSKFKQDQFLVNLVPPSSVVSDSAIRVRIKCFSLNTPFTHISSLNGLLLVSPYLDEIVPTICSPYRGAFTKPFW